VLPLRDNVPTRTFPVVTVGLIAANAAVFLWELSRPGLDLHVVRYGYYPCDIVSSCVDVARLRDLPWYESVFTSMFMHGGWLHIGGNMLFLWIFGNNVEDSLGRLRFLAFYVAGGLAATLAQTAVTLHYTGAAGESVPNIGASGAIAAVLGAYFVLLPTAKVLTWIVIVVRELPAFFFLGVWFAFELWQGGGALTHPQAGGGVAFFAHIGGFVFGALTVTLVKVRDPLRPSW
jgi:membrane associated rhomboid family serine protease